MELDEQCLHRLHFVEIEILDVIDRFCRAHGIAYSLFAGSLLGAVRHQNFIPWDDDLDISMTRENYDRFLTLWAQKPPEGYILQNKENSPAFSQSFSKIRKDHTTFLQFDSERGSYHTGIFVDVFPIDRIPNGKLQRGLYYWRCMKYQLYTREFAPEGGRLLRSAGTMLLKLVPHEKRMTARQRLLRKITKYNRNDTLDMVSIASMRTLRCVFAHDTMDRFIRLPFGGREYMCISQWDMQLRAQYGDYMQLPPEEARVWKHHPILIDFAHNYNELQ